MRTTLQVKKKFGFIDGSVTEPVKNAVEYEDWVFAKSMVTLWILNMVEPKVRIQEIKAELAFCRQGNMSVIEYFRNLQVIWEDLLNYETALECKCGGCMCNLNSGLEKKCEEDRIH